MEERKLDEVTLLEHYNRIVNYSTPIDLTVLVTILDYFDNKGIDIRNKEVIDLGCGNGRVTNLMVATFSRSCIGVDYSTKRIEAARKAYPFIQFFDDDIHSVLEAVKTGVIDKPDIVTMFEVIEHIEDPINTVKNIFDELLADGGILICSVPIKSYYKTHRSIFKDDADIENSFGLTKIATLRKSIYLGYKIKD